MTTIKQLLLKSRENEGATTIKQLCIVKQCEFLHDTSDHKLKQMIMWLWQKLFSYDHNLIFMLFWKRLYFVIVTYFSKDFDKSSFFVITT